MFSRIPLCVVTGLAIIGFAAGAYAASPAAMDPDAASIKVEVADLNLGAVAGAKIALQRIDRAARSICGQEPDPRDLKFAGVYSDCVTRTVGNAVASLDNPTVTALYSGRPTNQLASAHP